MRHVGLRYKYWWSLCHFSVYLRLKGTFMLDASGVESVNHFLSSEDRNQNPLMTGPLPGAFRLLPAMLSWNLKKKKKKSSTSSHGYLLHRVLTAFVQCASSPSSSSAPIASPSWTRRGSSPRIPAAGRNVGCTGTGLGETQTFSHAQGRLMYGIKSIQCPDWSFAKNVLALRVCCLAGFLQKSLIWWNKKAMDQKVMGC